MRIKNWLLPTQENLGVLVDKAIESDEKISSILNENNKEEIRTQLEGYLVDSYNENKFMRNFATVVDVWDKALVPVGALSDYMMIMGGEDIGISIGKEAVEMAVKLPYMIYFTAKTKKLKTTAVNLGYEALSWLVPGSVLDLTNRYARQADEYILGRAKENFLKKIH